MSKSQNDVEIESSKDLAKLIKKTKLVVIKLSASWCGPCKNKTFLESYNLLKLKYKTNTLVDFIEFDIDKNANIIEDREFYDISIDSIPTLMITNNGNFTRKYEGTACINDINEYLIKSLSNQ